MSFKHIGILKNSLLNHIYCIVVLPVFLDALPLLSVIVINDELVFGSRDSDIQEFKLRAKTLVVLHHSLVLFSFLRPFFLFKVLRIRLEVIALHSFQNLFILSTFSRIVHVKVIPVKQIVLRSFNHLVVYISK